MSERESERQRERKGGGREGEVPSQLHMYRSFFVMLNERTDLFTHTRTLAHTPIAFFTTNSKREKGDYLNWLHFLHALTTLSTAIYR